MEARWKDNPPVWPHASLPAGCGRAWLVAWASRFDDMLMVEMYLAEDAMELLGILNRATGMDISPDAPCDSSCKLFLKTLENERCEYLRVHE